MVISLFISVASFILLFIFIFCGNSYIPATKDAVLFFFENVFPTMFPFYVLSSVITSSAALRKLSKPLKFMAKPFKLPAEASCAIILGLLCGFPVGAKVTSDLLTGNCINKRQAAVLASFTNNVSPVFAVSIIGKLYFKNEFLGFLIWVCLSVSGLISGLIISKIADKFDSLDNISYKKETKAVTAASATSITDSVISGINTSLYVGGVIIFFSSVTSLIKQIPFFSTKTYVFLYSFLEMTGGLKEFNHFLSNISMYTKLIAVMLISSWSGLCVHMQICGILKSANIKTNYYFLSKIFQTLLCFIIGSILYLLLLRT